MTVKPDNKRPSPSQSDSSTPRFELESVSPGTEKGKEPHPMSHVRSEFLHEKNRLSEDHVIVDRVGYVGSKRGEFVDRLNKLYGADGWTIGYVLDGKALSRDEALVLYEKSYEIFLKNNPSITNRLVNEAREIYDTAPSNVESGLDYHKQEDVRSHLQDIAIRRAMKTLGLSFKGDKLMQVREAGSDFPELSPGKVPFALSQDKIILPIQYEADWIQPGSVEDFWQNNKYVFATRTPEVATKLRSEVGRMLAVGDKAELDMIQEGASALLLLGEGDKTVTQQYIDYVHKNDLSSYRCEGVLLERIEGWACDTLDNLSHSLLTRPAPFKDVLAVVDALSPTYGHFRSPYGIESFIGMVPASLKTTVHAAMACTFMNYLGHGEWNTRENFDYVLNTPGVLEMLKTNEECRNYIKSTKLMQQSAAQISDQLDTVLLHPSERRNKEQLRAILHDIKKNG